MRTSLFVLAAVVLVFAAPARADSPPALVRDLWPGPNSSSPRELTAYQGALYFTAADQTGFGLWRSDGADVTAFKRTDSAGRPVVAGGALFVEAHEAATGRELWRSVGGAPPALVKDLEPGGGGSNPSSLTAVGTTLYFDAFTTAGGRALWRSDGTADGTVPVKSFGNQPLRSLTAAGSLLYFVADDGVNGRELWRSDGTAAGTFMVRDIDPAASSSPSMLMPFGGALVFAATDPANGTELWRSDGTTATLLEDVWPGPNGSNPRFATALGGALYFAAEDARGRELWRTDGTDATFVGDIDPGPASSDPRWLTAVSGAIVFEAGDAAHGRELWRSNGTTTTLVRDINPGAGDGHVRPSGDSGPERFAVADGSAYMQADDSTRGNELWRSDGTSASLVADINPGPASSQPEELTAAGNRVFFSAQGPNTGTELWSFVLGPSADLAVALAADPPRPRVGDRVTLTVTARNLGPEPTAGVRMRVDLPPGVTLDSAPASYQGGVWTVGALANGATATLTLTVTVTGASPVVTARVIASDLTDPAPANDSATLTLTPPEIVVRPGCNLVHAIIAANTDAPSDGCPAGQGADLIVLAAGSTHTLITAYETPADGATGLPSITSDITIAGNGATVVRAGGAPDFRLFRVAASGSLTLRDLTLRGGSSTQSGGGLLALAGGRAALHGGRVEGGIAPNGGGIASLSGVVSLTGSTVTDNTGINGAGIYAAGGTLSLVDSTVSVNRASHPTVPTFGGGIYANAALTITRGTLAGNTAGDGGGLVTLVSATLDDVTVSANRASLGFGGIDNRGTLTLRGGRVVTNVSDGPGGGIGNAFAGIGTLTVTGATVSGNRATEGGGVASWGATTIDSSTVASNLALTGGGLMSRGPATIASSTFSANAVEHALGNLSVDASTIVGAALRSTAAARVTGSIVPQCVGAIADGGGNVGCFTAGVDPLLGPLADNGGPTATHAPLPGSPAIDAAAACPAVDQRGVARPADGDGDGAARCDAGAVEAPAAAPVAGPPAPVAKVAPPPPAAVKLKPAAGIGRLPRTLAASGTTVTLATASNPPTASTTQTLTRGGTVLARGSTRIPAGAKRRLTLKLTKAGVRAARRGTVKARLRIVATAPDGTRETLTRTLRLKRHQRSPSRQSHVSSPPKSSAAPASST